MNKIRNYRGKKFGIKTAFDRYLQGIKPDISYEEDENRV